MSQASVIILNYNGVNFLRKFLPSVVQYSQGHRVIVADNGSDDHSVSFLKENFPSVEIIPFQENYGFARGYNEAIKHIDTPYSILLNSDVEVTGGWIEPVLALMEQNPKVAACQPKVRFFLQKNFFEHAGAGGGFIDIVAYPFCRGRIFDIIEKDEGQYDDVVPIFWATGACFFTRTDLFREMGGFDEIFHAHMEEIDLCWRMHARGYEVYYQPESVVYHVGGGTMPVSNPVKTYLNFRNSTGMLFKNLPSHQLLWRLPLKIALDLLAAVKFFLEGRNRDGKAVLQSITDFARNLGKWKKHRKKVTVRLKGASSGVLPRLLVSERYLKGKKYFSELEF